MSQKGVLGNALAKVAGPLKDFVEKLGGEDGEKWLEALKRFLRKEEPWPTPEFPVWRMVRVGGLGGSRTDLTAQYLLRVLTEYGIVFDKSSLSNTFGQPAFVEATEVDLVQVTTITLGFRSDCHVQCWSVCKRAKELGLEPCPPEVGPQLCLQSRDQIGKEEVSVITTLTTPTSSSGRRLIFLLTRKHHKRSDKSEYLRLRVWWPSIDELIEPSEQLVFCRPRK